MVKILIADDEVPIREWMVFSINQLDLPCEIVGVAADGNEALQLFLQHHPDLIFTDIKMPCLDGMELTRRIRQIGSAARVVFLTSHSNFDFARQAIQLGAEAYILKTEIRAESIAEHIRACQGKADDAFSQQVRKQSFVPAILRGEASTAQQVERELHDMGYPLQNSPLAVIAVSLSQPLSDEIPVPKQGLTREGLFENLCCFSYQPDILLISANLPQVPSTLLQTQALSQFADAISDYFQEPVGVSGLHPHLGCLRLAMQESIRCLSLLFYGDRRNRLFFFSALRTVEVGALKQQVEELCRKLGNQSGLTVLEELLEYLQRAQSTDITLVKDSVVGLLNAMAAKNIHNTATFLEAAQEIDTVVAAASTFSSLGESACELTQRLEDGWSAGKGRQIGTHVRLAMDYVRSSYADSPSLTDAARYVGISSEHLSRLFKQEMGATFVGYLTAYRMKRAMELLQTTSLKIYEVAEQTGYTNMSYFSKSFKKQFGCNPFQVRSGCGEITTT